MELIHNYFKLYTTILLTTKLNYEHNIIILILMKGLIMDTVIYRGFYITETKAKWTISSITYNYPAVELLKTDYKTAEAVYTKIDGIRKNHNSNRGNNE